MSYVYIRSEPHVWTCGFYDPQGKWIPESDWETPELAAFRTSFLNGDVTVLENMYLLVEWPQAQELRNKPGFQENAFLKINGCWDYFVKVLWLSKQR